MNVLLLIKVISEVGVDEKIDIVYMMKVLLIENVRIEIVIKNYLLVICVVVLSMEILMFLDLFS